MYNISVCLWLYCLIRRRRSSC